MIIRRYIGQFLVLLMLTMQIALAQHATVHFNEETQSPVHQQQDHQPDKDKLCQLCLLTKDITKTLTPTAPSLPAPVQTEMQAFSLLQAIIFSDSNPSPYAARAPPAFSA